MNKQEAIRKRWIIINRLFIFLVVFVVLILLLREFQSFRKSIEYFNQTSYDFQVHEISHEVDGRVLEIEAVKEKIKEDMKNDLKSIVQDVDYFATYAVNTAEPDLTLEEKRLIYIDSIYNYDIQEDNYLFFAMDLDGMSYLSGITKNIEGTDITYLQDEVTGRYFVLDMIDILNDSPDGEGFIEYYWIKELGGEHLLKTSYLYYNEEVDLFIGTGVYDIDYSKTVKEELFHRISSYYDNTDQYIYFFGYDGSVIYHPQEDFETEDLLAIKTVDNVGFHEYIIDELQDKENTSFDYYFDFTGEHQLKTAYVHRIDEWDMYIGKSFIFDDLKLEQEAYLKDLLIDYTVYNILALLSVITLVYLLRKLINSNFKDVEEEFEHQNDLVKEASFLDQLTNIYNRSYFESKFQTICEGCGEVSAIMIDANGLKLINDAYGHSVGDKLLVTLSELIVDSFQNGFHFRWGGDEFLIIMHNSNEKEILDMIQIFQDKCKKTKIKDFAVSASVGYALNNEKTLDIYKLIKAAETMMYDNKTYESLSTKRKIIDNILETLYNSFSFEKEHSENVKNYAMLIGQKLKFKKDELGKLRLAALMHDVGKIAVSDQILGKTEKLTEDEFTEVKKHTEKGFRILSAYPELSEFGNYSLTHHERFDGTGYPRGLSKDEIPLFSRIISVADAYDAMTSDRVYKPAMTKEEAIKELVDNKGKQFDPKIVDVFIKVI